MLAVPVSTLAALALAMGRGYFPVPSPPPVAEAQACAAVSPGDADLALSSEALTGVAPLHRITRSGRHLAGATLTYSAGVTPERLRAALDCLSARGREHPIPSSPLAVKGVEVGVHRDGRGLRAELTVDDVRAAGEVLARSQRLIAGSSR
jgi:hypothetical protein